MLVSGFMQCNAMRDENAVLRKQLQEHQALAASLQDQSAEQSRIIHAGNQQLKQLQSKVDLRSRLYGALRNSHQRPYSL